MGPLPGRVGWRATPSRGPGEEESEAAFRRNGTSCLSRGPCAHPAGRAQGRGQGRARSPRGHRSAGGERDAFAPWEGSQGPRGAGRRGPCPPGPWWRLARPSDGLSTAVSPWKCPPAWAPPGIPRSRCLPTAELCSTLRPNWLESEVPHFKQIVPVPLYRVVWGRVDTLSFGPRDSSAEGAARALVENVGAKVRTLKLPGVPGSGTVAEKARHPPRAHRGRHVS